MRLLERNIASIERHLVLLAPERLDVPASFRNVAFDSTNHDRLMREMQQLRGRVYVADGAVQPGQLAHDGSHQTPEDERSWHLLMVNGEQKITACAWYMPHRETAAVRDLRVRSCPLALVDGWRQRLWHAVESELARARRERIGYAEVGGWAVAKEHRCTSHGLLLALAAYGLGGLMGGALGLTTATVRHESSTILRRIGGAHLETSECAMPPYYDPHYRCEMELIRFDSRRPNPRYAKLVELLQEQLIHVRVVASSAHASAQTFLSSPATPRPQFASWGELALRPA